MLTFKLIRKVGKILRGGAGRKEILLGTLFGVLIGFNPGFNVSLLLTFLFALLLNANFSFLVLGAAIGKLISLPAAVVSFHIGYTVIHNIGLEELFRSLCNAPVTALMDLNVYAMVGSFPLALAAGIILGSVFGATVVRIRKKMLEADQHEIVGKAFGNKVSRLLLRLAFGKSKLSLDDEIPQQAPWLRKSGLILVAVIVVISLVLEFFLLDHVLRKGIESSIAAQTGAEVNVADAHFSLARGEIRLEGLQVTDPNKPTHNMIEIDRLVADLAVGELLSRNYEVDLLAGSTLKRNTQRPSPGAVYEKDVKPEEPAAETEQEASGKSLDDYLASAGKWKSYGEKAYDYLKKRKENAQSTAKGRKPEPSKEAAVADAEQLGYLNAKADLVADRPAWVIHKLMIESVRLDDDNWPEQILEATELSSHPELNAKPTKLALKPIDGSDPSIRIVLRFDDPSAPHALMLNLKDLPLADTVETSASFPIDIRDGRADLRGAGKFTAEALEMPFTLLIHGLKADVEDGEEVMGMDSATATEVFSSMEQLEIDGSLSGSILAPRVRIDYEKLTANIKEALLAAGKKELSKRANAEMDKAKDELKKQAGEEVNKLLEGEDGGSLEDKAKSSLKNLF